MQRNTAQFRRIVLFLLLALRAHEPVSLGALEKESCGGSSRKRVDVADSIEMTRLGDRGSSLPGNTNVASFSPDGSHFTLIVIKGNIKKGVNESSVLLFLSSGVFGSSKPEVLLTMSSSSNREAIRKLRWLSNDAFCFIGENAERSSEIYIFHIRTKELERLTNHSTPVLNYDITVDARTVLFSAESSERSKKDLHQGPVIIDGLRLYDLLSGNYAEQQGLRGQEVFFQRKGHQESRLDVPSEYFVDGTFGTLSLSPGGRYAMVGVMLRQIPEAWFAYKNELISAILSGPQLKIGLTPVTQALLYDSESEHLAPVLNAPMGFGHGDFAARWAEDDRSVFIRSYLPLDSPKSGEQSPEARDKIFSLRITLPNREFSIAGDSELTAKQTITAPLNIQVKEDLNSPQKIVVSDPETQKESVLMDLNPKFCDLDLGTEEIIQWMVEDGVKVEGGLYLPPDYIYGKRYPLVIQTHGFDRDQFSMDGLRDWSSAYAARALAAKGIVVLQAFNYVSQEHDNANDRPSGNREAFTEQAKLNLESSAYEKAIDYLDVRGLIDRDRVGLVGFSRTVCYVAYTLTHSKYHFAAASLVDGVDCGYFQSIAYPSSLWDIDRIYGGVLPFGAGLKTWLRDSPSFSLDKVDTPVSLLALRPEGILEQWEWYAGLGLQGKPVSFILVSGDKDDRDANNHLLVKPWEKKIAQEHLVDWFCFWLNGYEDSDPNKKDQYLRWNKLRR